MPEFLDVDPRLLHLPSGRSYAPDPLKWARQLSQFGRSTTGMPPILVTRGKGGGLVINNRVTRAARVAKLLPGQTVRVEVMADLPSFDVSAFPTVGDRLP